MRANSLESGIQLSFKFLFLFALLLFGIRLNIIDAFSSFLPVYDDWGMGGLLQEYESGVLPSDYVLKANNGHIALWRDILQIFLFDVNQSQWDTRLQMMVNALIWAGCATFLVKVIRPHFSGVSSVLAVLMIFVLWAFPISLINATWGVQTHSYVMVSFTVFAFWLMTSPAFTKSWFAGVFFTAAVPLSMGGGALVAPAIFSLALLRVIFDAPNRRSHMPTLVVSALLSVYSVWLTRYAADGAFNHYASHTFIDFLTTSLKALSYPIHKQVWPSLFLVLPLGIVLIQAIRLKAWNDRTVLFVLSIAAYAVALAFSIGYARGNNGMNPSDRYFEFLQIYTLASFLSLLILAKPKYRIGSKAFKAVAVAWSTVFIVGVIYQVNFTSNTAKRLLTEKPRHEKTVIDYLYTGDRQAVIDLKPRDVPYPSNLGLMSFVDKVTQEDIMVYQLQTPEPLVREDVSTAFTRNGVTRSTGEAYKYRYEDVMGSYDRDHKGDNGGSSADGTYLSQIFATNRQGLMIPVTGHLGFPDMTLQLVDLKTEERTDIIPEKVGRDNIEGWQEVFVPTPENAFRIIAIDNNPERWFGFAAPRTVGKLSGVSNWLISQGQLIWLLALFGFLLLLVDRKKLVGLFRT